MTKTNKTKNGRKVSTLVRNASYELSFSRPAKGVKSESTHLNVTGFNPATGEVNKVRLDGRAVATLRKILAK
jgi:hypothetical protein